jgi:TldD protein
LGGAGYEFLLKADMPGHAERIAAEAVEHSMAKPVERGLKDLVLLPSHLGLTIHEIVAHATEVDRIAGYEANYAGTSFVKIADLGKLKYGSKHFNVSADRTFPTGMATVRFRRRRREERRMAAREGRDPRRSTDQPRTAHLIGEKESRGCTFANHWRNYPFLRMPNVSSSRVPGSPTVDQMIADVKDGVWWTARAVTASISNATTVSSVATRSGKSRTARRRGWSRTSPTTPSRRTSGRTSTLSRPPEAWEHHEADRRCERAAGAVESPVARLSAVSDSEKIMVGAAYGLKTCRGWGARPHCQGLAE